MAFTFACSSGAPPAPPAAYWGTSRLDDAGAVSDPAGHATWTSSRSDGNAAEHGDGPATYTVMDSTLLVELGPQRPGYPFLALVWNTPSSEGRVPAARYPIVLLPSGDEMFRDAAGDVQTTGDRTAKITGGSVLLTVSAPDDVEGTFSAYTEDGRLVEGSFHATCSDDTREHGLCR